MPSVNSSNPSPDGNAQSQASPRFSLSSHHSAVSPRLTASSAASTPPMSPSSSQQTTPSLSGRSLSIKRKPVPAYMHDDLSLQNGRPHQNGNGKVMHILSVDPPLGEEEVLRSPVRVSFDQGFDSISEHGTPFSGFAQDSPHLVRSLSARSSKSLPTTQKRPMDALSLGNVLPADHRTAPNANTRNEEPEDLPGGARRGSEVSMASSISSGNSDFAQPNGSRPPSAARNVVLGRSMYNLNSPEANNMSTAELFTIPPTESPNSRIHQLRAAKSQPGLHEDRSGSQGHTAVRISTDKSLKERSAADFTPKATGRGDNGTIEGLTGLGISGAGIVPAREVERPLAPASHEEDVAGIHLTQSRLNHSLPSLPLSRTQSNLAAPPMQREKGIFRKKLAKLEDEFSERAVPTPMRLWEASQCHLVDETGRKRRFGDFWDTYSAHKHDGSDEASLHRKHKSGVKSMARDLVGHHHRRHVLRSHASDSRQSSDGARGSVNEKNGSSRSGKHQQEPRIGGEEYLVYGRKTVVFWIRHFWCGQCQDYTLASLGLLDAEAIHRAGLNVIVISNGSWKIIKRYRGKSRSPLTHQRHQRLTHLPIELFRCPFPIYVDASRRLYHLMGMTKLSNDFGPSKDRAAYHQHAVPRQVVSAIGKGLFKMPLANPGTFTQLGGEFIVGPGLKCDFAHRMTNTSNHMEAFDVLRLAGIESCRTTDVQQAKIAQEELQAMSQLQQEEAEWRESRLTELERIKRRKDARRGMVGEETDLGADDGVPEMEGEEDELDPEERRRRFDEYRRRTGLTVDVEEDFDGFVVRPEIARKRLSTPMEHEEEEEDGVRNGR